jgi:S1-C subfamily serine protease
LQLSTSADGVAVVEVANGTFAQRLGFQRGDIIVAVNNQEIRKTRDLARVAEAGSRVWRVTIVRGGRTISAVFGG